MNQSAVSKLDLIQRWLKVERPTRSILIEQAGVSAMHGHRIVHGLALNPRPSTLARFEAVALIRREQLLDELMLLDALLAR